MLDYRVKTFLAVYRLGSFTAAARELHISQPAVSQHIRQLEAHYDCPLFSTQTRMVRATPAGELLFERLSVMVNDERRIEGEIGLLAGAAWLQPRIPSGLDARAPSRTTSRRSCSPATRRTIPTNASS